MNKDLISKLSDQARENVETRANDKDDTRWWHHKHFEQEFARLILEHIKTSIEKNMSTSGSYMYQAGKCRANKDIHGEQIYFNLADLYFKKAMEVLGE